MPVHAEIPTPLVIADACSLLDVIQAANHKNLGGEMVATEAVLAADPQKLRVAVCDVAAGEFRKHLDRVVSSTRNCLRGLRTGLLQADAIGRHLGLASTFTEVHAWEETIVEAGKTLAESLLDRALEIEKIYELDYPKAGQRIEKLRRPAQKGKNSLNDCLIAEMSIRVAGSRLHQRTFLLTSNVEDFGRERVHSDLAQDFATAELEYATSWREVAERLQIEFSL
jgi:hypothetical protein